MTSTCRSAPLRHAVRRALVSSGLLVPVWLYASAAGAQTALPPNVSAGSPQTVADSDGVPGETVVLQGVAESQNVSGDGTLTYVWLDGQTQISTALQPSVRLADGVHQLTLTATDNCCSSSSSLVSSSMVTITVQAPPQSPLANAGPDRTVADTDGVAGENVTLQGSGSSRNTSGSGTLTFVWTAGGQQVATGATPTIRLADGATQLQLTVTDNCCSSSSSLVATDLVTISVTAANRAPVANAGPDRAIADTDRQPGERVTLDASASTDSDGTIASYTWYSGESTLGTGRVLTDVRLPDGQNTITLVVTDNSDNSSSDNVVISVAEPLQRAKLADIAQTPNQKLMARALDDLCSRLTPTVAPVPTLAFGENPSIVAAVAPRVAVQAFEDVGDLAARCEGILSDPNAANQRKALDELGAQEFNAMRTPTVVFSQTQFQSVMDRLVALRAGERGTSVAGLNMRIGDRFVSLEDIADSLGAALGGGASSDENASGGLLSDRLGFWLRGNYGVGEKSGTDAGIGFDSDQLGLSGGVDYRFGQAAVAGLSLGYGKSNIDFTPDSQGGIDTKSLAASIYGSGYVGGLYLDGVLNYIDSDYESARHINYLEGTTAIDRVALGSTSGDAISGGAAIGYDFVVGAFTFAPSLGYYYVDTAIDPFTEHNAEGLNLAYDEQNYKSSTANAGIRASYAWKTSWGVFVPHFRGTFVREFEDSAEVFGVRFANDPFANAANPTPPIIIESDRIDRSYLRLALGASAQFAFGISGYFEYQRLEAYEQVQFHDFTVGLRMQRGF